MVESPLLINYKRKLVFRVAIFIIIFFMYLIWENLDEDLLNFGFHDLSFLHVIWVVFVFEFLLVFFRRSKVSMGSIKQFKRNYIEPKVVATKEAIKEARHKLNIQALKAFLCWSLLNGILAVLFYTKLIRNRELFLLSGAYYVADLICVIYFCPFQRWIMKNRCCVTCRIFNWDQLMIVTPLIFLNSLYSYTLIGIAAFAFIMWEYNFYRHTERFVAVSNDHLKCLNCTDKLCVHRKPYFPKSIKELKENIAKKIKR